MKHTSNCPCSEAIVSNDEDDLVEKARLISRSPLRSRVRPRRNSFMAYLTSAGTSARSSTARLSSDRSA